MNENQTVEQRLDTIERLLQGQKSVLTFEEGCEFTGLSKSYKETLGIYIFQNPIPVF